MQSESPCTCFAIRRLSRRITQLYDRHLAGVDLKTTQYSLLSHVRARPGLPMGELADLMGMERSTLTRNLRPLTDAGWVLSSRGAPDTRTVCVALSPAGEQLLRRARVAWKHAQAALEAELGPVQARHLHHLAEAVSQRLEHSPLAQTA